jgi:hypothetical protein
MLTVLLLPVVLTETVFAVRPLCVTPIVFKSPVAVILTVDAPELVLVCVQQDFMMEQLLSTLMQRKVNWEIFSCSVQITLTPTS